MHRSQPLGCSYRELGFADRFLLAAELLDEDNRLFQLLDRIEQTVGSRITPLIDEAKIAYRELVGQQIN